MTLVPPLHRRGLLAGAAATLAAGAASASQRGDLISTADAAYTFAIPLLEMARVRGRAFGIGQTPGVFAGRRDLVTPAQRAVTMPNNDTVYASVFADLRKGPAVFTLPRAPDRYVSLQVMDFYSNNIAVVSSRDPSAMGGELRIVGPGETPAPGEVAAPTPWIWALARVLVDGPEDLAAALAIRDQVRLAAAQETATPPVTPPFSDSDIAAELAAIQALLTENPPLAQDRAVRPALEALGLLGGAPFTLARFSAGDQAQILAGVRRARVHAKDPTTAGRLHDGWFYNDPAIGVFGRNYRLRAAVATSGLAALPPEEATYVKAQGPAGQTSFEGPGPWVLRLPGSRLPPVDGFWSATLYEPTASGQYFLTRNPIDRYAIGDRTPGLVRGADGGLDIWIARQDPGPERRANWLPAPQKGAFVITLRAYLPRRAMLDGAYRLPPIQTA